MNTVIFYAADTPIPLKSRKAVKNLIRQIFLSEKYKLNRISYIFCSDEYLLRLNKQHLNHDFYTDTLTYCLSTRQDPIEGEVYISTERIKENAKSFKVKYEIELLRVIIHGALHLCGYEDNSKFLKEKMNKKENFYLHLYEIGSRET